ncbi:MAG TPA: acireductone synthase [Saprospiraceae bacterium]|nr:acireductone synthase [Saprospiraceae bacterium]HMP25686.1 acireductone synthase [Saprospiraceae bacterium]
MIKYILTDIEGTTTDIAFVHKILFPYSEQKLPAFVRAHAAEPTVAACVGDVEQTLRAEQQIEVADLEQCIAALLEWIRQDRKHPALKQLQGLIWQAGYETGGFQGHVYPDVVPQLTAWRAQGLGIGIYSSGSVAAQRLLFGHSVFGDLNHLFDHYFDTGMGHKRAATSYTNIAAALQLPPAQILFLSDVVEELDAARAAGMRTLQLVRPGTTFGNEHPTARDFSEVVV